MKHRVNFRFSRSCLNAIGIAFAFIACFSIMEIIVLPLRFQAFFTLLIVGGILYVLYLSISRRKFLEKYFVLGLGLLVIINKLYDPVIFEEYFSFPLLWGVLIVAAIVLLRIICPLFMKLVKWFRARVTIVEEVLPNTLSIGMTSAEKHPFQTKQTIHSEVDGQTIENVSVQPSEHLQKPVSNQISKHETIQGEHVTGGDKQTLRSRGKEFFANINYALLGELSITVLLLGMSVWLSTQMLKWVVVYEELDAERLLENVNMLIPFVLIGVLATIVIFILLCTYSKLVRVMIHILKGEESPTVYVLGILLVSLFISKSGYFSQDKMLNLFTEGNLFSFPIAAVIIYPFFVLSANTVNQLLKNGKVYSKMLEAAGALAKKVLRIGYDIIDSTITLIQFVTSDFLGSMLAIIGASDEEEEIASEEAELLEEASEDRDNEEKEDDKVKEDTEDECEEENN